MTNFKAISLILIICCYSCTNDSKYVSEKEWDGKDEFVHGKIIGQLPINQSRKIYIVDSLILIGDAASEPVYRVYKIVGDDKIEYVSGFGTRGQGPNEFIWDSSLQIEDDTISIFDKSLMRNYLVAKQSLINDNISMLTRYVPNTSSFANFIMLKHDLYFGNVISAEGLFAFYQNDSIMFTDISYPDDDITVGNIQKGMVYQCCLAKQPKGNKIVYAGCYGRIFEIYEYSSGTSIKKVFSDIYEYPRYKSNNSSDIVSANFTEDNRVGFFSVSVTHEYIYALYCGKKDGEKKTDAANVVYLYDWNGKKIKKYILDKEIVGISVNSQNNKIYALYDDEEDDILKVVCFNL